jgi:DNA-binding TFAR19-related protein (PDSD5 family)
MDQLVSKLEVVLVALYNMNAINKGLRDPMLSTVLSLGDELSQSQSESE